jgi:hypothetical protein
MRDFPVVHEFEPLKGLPTHGATRDGKLRRVRERDGIANL